MQAVPYLAAACGVITSVLLPVMIQAVRKDFATAVPALKKQSRVMRIVRIAWPALRKYVTLLAFSLLTAFLIVAGLGETLTTWQSGFLAGYAWDSTVQKFAQRP